MEDLRPILVTAPLNVYSIDEIDTKLIYVFDYNNSFIGYNDKPSKMISYIQSIGGMNDILTTSDTSYEDKECLLLEYFNAGVFFNIYSLTNTMIKILFKLKEIPFENNTILTDVEIDRFISRNGKMMNDLIKFYDSLFLLMLLYSTSNTKTLKTIKLKYPKERINKQEISPNICNLLLCSEFYDYYDKHVGNDLQYYEFLFENNLYMGMTFLDILTNNENRLLPIFIDLNNDKFLNYIQEQQKKRS